MKPEDIKFTDANVHFSWQAYRAAGKNAEYFIWCFSFYGLDKSYLKEITERKDNPYDKV